MNEPEVIVPARRDAGSATGRLVKSFLPFAVLLTLGGLHRGSLPEEPLMGDSASAALMWYALAAIFGGTALLVGYARWIRTGRL